MFLRTVWVGVASLSLAVVAVGPQGNPAGATTAAGSEVERFQHEQLLDASTVVLQGRPGELSGQCRHHIPALSMDPGGGEVAAQPVSIDHASCTVVWEVGRSNTTSAADADVADDGAGDVAPDDGESVTGSAGGSGEAVEGSVSSPGEVTGTVNKTSAYFKVYWHDVAHATTSRLQSNIEWSYAGGEIVSSKGRWSDFYLTGTGWYRYQDPSATIYRPTPIQHYVVTDGKYRNKLFCTGMTITTHYSNIRIYANGSGSKSGRVDDTWTTEAPSDLAWKCPNLHPHTKIGSP